MNLVFLLILLSCKTAEAQETTRFEYQKGKITTLPDHPRLFFSKKEEEKVLELAKKSSLLENMLDILRVKADAKINSPLIQGDIDLGKSREAVSRILTLSLAYRLFEETKYAKRVEEELLNISDYESWHPDHFLDVAEMTTAVAIGYDWCYDQLSEEAKSAVERSIQENAFSPAWPVYKDGDEGSWAKRNTNWNVVTNTGLVTGALAIADIYPNDARKIIQYAAQYTPNNIGHFAPNGVYYEGPDYWSYTNIYLSLLLDNFNRILNNDFGLSSMEGVRETAKYYINTLSPNNREFNFADARGTDATLAPIYFFYSKHYNQPEVAKFYRSYLKESLHDKNREELSLPRFFFMAIPWFDDINHEVKLQKPELQVYEGEPDIVAFNGKEKNTNGIFLIAKGGKPDMAHNQLDVGSFVVESQGVRWGIDLGSENYSLPDFWDYKPDGVRWTYFRNNNLSHNTINIDGSISNSRGNGTLSRHQVNGEEPFGIYDMSSSYIDQADSVMRGFKMLPSDIMLIRDEVKLKNKDQEVNWRFFTNASVRINDNVVKLEQDNKSFYLKTSPQENIRIKVNDVESKSPQEKSIDGVKMIEVTASTDTDNNNWVDIPIIMGDNIGDLEKIGFDEFSFLAKW